MWDGMNYVRTGPHKHAPLSVGAVVQQTPSGGPPAAAISAYLRICAICGAKVHFSGQHDAARYVCVCVCVRRIFLDAIALPGRFYLILCYTELWFRFDFSFANNF